MPSDAASPSLGSPASTVVVMAGTALFGWAIRNDAGYTIGRAIAVGFLCILAAYCAGRNGSRM